VSTKRRWTAIRPTRSSRGPHNAAQGTPGSAGKADSEGGGLLGGLNDVLFGSTGPRGGRHDGLAQSMAKSAVRTMGSTVGREILRGVMGSIFGGRKR
jgi:hypothetical protein